MEMNKTLDELFEGIKRPLGATPVNIESAPDEVKEKILQDNVYPRPDITAALQYPRKQTDKEIKRTEKFENAMTVRDNKMLAKFFATPFILNDKKDIENVIDILEKLIDVGVFDDEEEIK